MCGIAGILSPSGANPGAVAAMNEAQRYRGPDAEGLWVSPDGACALGHRRLSIIDLSERGRQPMLLEERELAITYNGEIYNFVELRDRLRGLGHVFRSDSDTEVLLRAYAQWGTDCLAELNGMFAFALWDGRRRVLFCARDRFGEKPFVYALLAGSFAFASEAKALALLRGVSAEVDDGVLAAYVEEGSTRADSYERTLLRDVRQLLPAHALEVRLGREGAELLRSWCWWSVDVAGRAGYAEDDAEASAGRLLELLTDSVRLRLRSDVPVGSCLSGGLDSSSVVCLIRRLEPGADLRTFTGRFPGDPSDEGRYAKLVTDACQTHAFEVAPTPERFAEEAERVYWHADFPLGGMSQFAQWCVFHLASQSGVTVLLDGQGSDELFGGYGNSIAQAFLRQLAAQGRWRAWLAERAAAARRAPALFSWPRLLLARPELAPVRAQLRRWGGRSLVSSADLFRGDWREGASASRPAPAPEELRGDEHALSRILWTLSFRSMLSSLLRFGDRLSMAHSREVRLPFCDHRIAEFAFRLSPELLVGDGQVKRVLRLAIRDLVPPAIATRAKQGFVPPQDGWLLGPLAGFLRELAGEPGPLAERLDRERIAALTGAGEAARRREVGTLWELCNLLCWSRFALAPLREGARHEVSAAAPAVAPAPERARFAR
jgi:asparagine synthase (glutamine-hydrolysing)